MRKNNNQVEDLAASHTSASIQQRLQQPRQHSYLSDFVFGGIDGAVTTFAVVSGVAGAGLSSSIVIILGLANLVGDGFSMAAGNFLGTRADEQLRHRARLSEKRHIQEVPDGEREEIRQIFSEKGFEGDDLERAVEIITRDVDRWVDTMLTDELGLSLSGPNPWKAGFATFASFLFVGILPLAPFLIGWFAPGSIPDPFLWSAVATGIAFFLIGTAKANFVEQRWYWAGLETLVVGGIAAGLAYWIGAALRDLAPGMG